MQRNGVIGQEFVCVKTERWCTGKTHTHAHTEGLFIRVSTLEGNRPAWPRIICLKARHHGVLFLVGNQCNLTVVGHTTAHTHLQYTVYTLLEWIHTDTRHIFYEVIYTCFHSNQTNVYLSEFLFYSVFYHPTGQTQMTPQPSTIR